MLVAAGVGSLNYETKSLFFSGTTSYRPDLIAGAVALFLVLPIWLGDYLHNHKLDVLNALTLLTAFYVASIFIRIGLGASESFISGPATLFAILVLVVINLNPKRYGELAILGLILCGSINFIKANSVMGEWGFVLLTTAALGSVLIVDMRKLAGNVVPFYDPKGLIAGSAAALEADTPHQSLPPR